MSPETSGDCPSSTCADALRGGALVFAIWWLRRGRTGPALAERLASRWPRLGPSDAAYIEWLGLDAMRAGSAAHALPPGIAVPISEVPVNEFRLGSQISEQRISHTVSMVSRRQPGGVWDTVQIQIAAPAPLTPDEIVRLIFEMFPGLMTQPTLRYLASFKIQTSVDIEPSSIQIVSMERGF